MFEEDFGPFPAALASPDWGDWDAVDRWESDNTPADTADEGHSSRDVRPLPVRAGSAQDRAGTRQRTTVGSQEEDP